MFFVPQHLSQSSKQYWTFCIQSFLQICLLVRWYSPASVSLLHTKITCLPRLLLVWDLTASKESIKWGPFWRLCFYKRKVLWLTTREAQQTEWSRDTRFISKTWNKPNLSNVQNHSALIFMMKILQRELLNTSIVSHFCRSNFIDFDHFGLGQFDFWPFLVILNILDLLNLILDHFWSFWSYFFLSF